MQANLFRRAKRLLDKKDSGAELTEEELGLVNTAIIPLMVKADGIFPEDITIGEGLEKLARMVEEGPVAVSRRRAGAAHRRHKPKVVGSSPTAAIPERM